MFGLQIEIIITKKKKWTKKRRREFVLIILDSAIGNNNNEYASIPVGGREKALKQIIIERRYGEKGVPDVKSQVKKIYIYMYVYRRRSAYQQRRANRLDEYAHITHRCRSERRARRTGYFVTQKRTTAYYEDKNAAVGFSSVLYGVYLSNGPTERKPGLITCDLHDVFRV